MYVGHHKGEDVVEVEGGGSDIVAMATRNFTKF